MPVFSDLYLNKSRDLKVEVLPIDFINQQNHVLEIGDSLTTVFRPLDSDFVAKRLHSEFIDELKERAQFNHDSKVLIKETLSTFQASFECAPAETKLVPHSTAMGLIAYFSSSGKIILFQIGSVCIKERKNGRFLAISEARINSINLEYLGARLDNNEE